VVFPMIVLLHVYVFAPVAVKLATLLTHTLAADCMTPITGSGFTTTGATALWLQPKEFMPVIV